MNERGVFMDLTRIRYMKNWISQLPQGNITFKTINGKRYPYYQWTENGKQRNRIVKADEFEELSQKIEQRKVLEKKLRESSETETVPEIMNETYFFSSVIVGDELLKTVNPTKKLKKRECYSALLDYVYGDSFDKVFILYGLRRTGKTTLIRQLIADMPEEMFSKTAFIQMNSSIDLAKINLDLKLLSEQGYQYIFIDEVTLMDDFIDSAALFSDVYAARGMKVVLSGTDSLGFVFSEDRELYDRCVMVHTTFISYREFSEVLGIEGIDNYIRYAGTMTLSGNRYNVSNATFAAKKTTDEYIDTAIAQNIQHSLKNYNQGDHFRHLFELYEAHELTSVINRIVERENKRFTINTLTQTFKSGDFGETKKNLLKDSKNPSDILYLVDEKQIIEWFRKELDILNKPEMSVTISDIHVKEIREYLDLLDLTLDIDVIDITDLNKKETHTVITQAGLRYAQATALIESLIRDAVFASFPLTERKQAKERLLSTIQGKMMEDIILLETKIAHPQCEVFKLKFAVGEFDMVVFDPETASCKIYEIKHSTEIHPKQTQHLTDEKKCADTEFRYGTIEGKYVIYRGKNEVVGDINYLNVEKYLCALKPSYNG